MSYDLWGRLRYVLSPQFDIYEAVSKLVRGNVIDIGSGTGFGTHLLTRQAETVLGCEIDESALNFSKRSFSNGNLTFQQLDITKLRRPLSPVVYDFVTMIDVIEHIEDDALAIFNCLSLLKQTGTFICSTPNRLSRYRKSDYHVREYSPDELRALLRLKFKIVNMVDFQLQPVKSNYTNPIIAVCS